MSTLHTSLTVSIAHETDRPLLDQLWTMFQHDMSAYTGALPDEHGRFRHERLDSSLHDPGWAAYLTRIDRTPVGLAIVRGIEADERVLNSFFIVNAARRGGHGRAAVRQITRRHPGPWAVAFQDANTVAAAFWRQVASETGPDWSIDRRAVPGRSDLPPDTWIRFRVPPPSR